MSHRSVRRGSEAATPARRAMRRRSTLEKRKRSALNGSGGIRSSANLLTLKFPPQITVTSSISRSWAERRPAGRGMREERRKDGRTEGRKVQSLSVFPSFRPSVHSAPIFPGMSQTHIRNFCIIAHIDHGKSTLADRLIEATGTLDRRQMRDQVLDTMDLERERGITIKLNAVRMQYTARDGFPYELNLIDTPGHVDFTYEVSRSLAACEGAILVVDASQGVQAQTLSNLFLAMDAGLEIIPVLNKIDLPGAEPEKRAQEIMNLIGSRREEILAVSAKEGVGIPELLEAIVARGPAPRGDQTAPLRALVFDCHFDRYRGAVPSIRVVDGVVAKGMAIRFGSHPEHAYQVDEVGFLQLGQHESEELSAGEVGYLVANLRGVRDARAGDTILHTPPRARAPRRRGRRAPRPPPPRPPPPGRRAPPGLPRREADGVRRPLPDHHGAVRGPPRRAGAAAAQRRLAPLRAGDLHRPGLRVPLRVPRPAAHGDRPGAAGAGIRPRAHHHRADGGIPRLPHQRRDGGGGEPIASAGPRRHRPDRGAQRQGAHHGAGGVHRRDHEAGPGSPRRLRRDALPRPGPSRVPLGVPAGAGPA